jgi:lipopolysaccharide/colanic/teichoic acid biosynthesis glycosyltransferase
VNPKRIFDIFASIFGLILLSPFLVVTAISVKITSSGSVLFIQERIGLDGKVFNLLKFRSMRDNTRTSASTFEAGNTNRVTGVGKIIRRTKLDELPQLLNVLMGHLSIVGPRPEVRKWTEVYPERWAIVLSVRPGITDMASIEFRNEEEVLSKQESPESYYEHVILPRKLELGIDYVQNNSFIGDLMIILKTIKVVFTK